MTGLWRCAVAAGLLAGVSATAAANAADREQTLEPLRHLLQAASRPIPPASSCQGQHGQQGAPRLRDLLASRLAYLHRGDNAITGACTSQRCELEIRHAAGEDVASAVISFEVEGGVLNLRSLRCVMTP